MGQNILIIWLNSKLLCKNKQVICLTKAIKYLNWVKKRGMSGIKLNKIFLKKIEKLDMHIVYKNLTIKKMSFKQNYQSFERKWFQAIKYLQLQHTTQGMKKFKNLNFFIFLSLCQSQLYIIAIVWLILILNF